MVNLAKWCGPQGPKAADLTTEPAVQAVVFLVVSPCLWSRLTCHRFVVLLLNYIMQSQVQLRHKETLKSLPDTSDREEALSAVDSLLLAVVACSV